MAGRPMTPFQAARLNKLLCLKLVPVGEGERVDWDTADKVLRDTAAAGLWTPSKPAEGYPRDAQGNRTPCPKANTTPKETHST